jgi:hypothetical protein
VTSKAFRENYDLIEWKPIEVKSRRREQHGSGPYFVPDIKPFVSPIDQTVISSRSLLREHEQRHGVRQVGDLKSPQDFDNRSVDRGNDRRLAEAYRGALQRLDISGD